MAKELSDHERYLRRVEALALSATPIPDGVIAAAPKHHDGVMVALIPDNPEDLALQHDEALPADDLHITLCYLGKVDEFSNTEKANIIRTAHRICDTHGQEFTAAADGVVVMGKNDQGVPATALLIQSEEIVELYDAMAEALDYESRFPTYIPHMTTGYGIPAEEAQERVGETIHFANVLVKFGDDRHCIPLSSTIVAAPRGANVIDRVIDSLGRMWDEALHPRDNEGRFIKKNGAISGKLAVPTRDRKGVEMVDANRASVVGFHTFDNEVWVLAEIKNDDGSTTQGFAKASEVRAAAPVKARLDALYPITEDDAFITSSMERKRQLDLLLAHVTDTYGPSNDTAGAQEFLDSLGLWEQDTNYINDGDDPDFLGGIRRVDQELTPDEIEEQQDIIEDARQVKMLRDRVHGLQEDIEPDAHTVPTQKLLNSDGPEQEAVEALRSGADPFSVETTNLLAAMDEAGRFEEPAQIGSTGVSPIGWRIDNDDQTGTEVRLAGTGQSTGGRAYFVKESVIGADMGNTDIVKEVLSSLIAEQVADTVGPDDPRQIPVPKSVFGDNPVWDGQTPDSLPGDATHQPAHVVSSHADYAVPPDWEKTTIADEEVALYNDIKGLDTAGQADVTLGHYEDMGEIYGNDIARLVLWDFLTLNGDRNPGNAILAAPPRGGQGRVLPIDHGFAFDESPLEDEGGTNNEIFEWFMNYGYTQAWMNYVSGGLDLDSDEVTPETIRRVFNDFIDVYSQIDAADISDRFREMPGVTEGQIATVEKALSGVVDRIEWMRDNATMILSRLTKGAA